MPWGPAGERSRCLHLCGARGEAVLLTAQLVGEAESFADLLQRILRFLPTCALKQVVCLLLLKLESAVGQYTGAALFSFSGKQKGKKIYTCLGCIAWKSVKLQAVETK